MKRILFVCVENAGRSQMAEALANHYGEGKIAASSGGVRVADEVNPIVVEAMKEKGTDISSKKPKLLTPRIVIEADQVITMGCTVEEVCPAPLFKKTTDQKLEDPKGKPIEKIRDVRDQIEDRLRNC